MPELSRPIVHKNSLAILIQNGLGIEAELAKEMPDILPEEWHLSVQTKQAPGTFLISTLGVLKWACSLPAERNCLSNVALILKRPVSVFYLWFFTNCEKGHPPKNDAQLN